MAWYLQFLFLSVFSLFHESRAFSKVISILCEYALVEFTKDLFCQTTENDFGFFEFEQKALK